LEIEDLQTQDGIPWRRSQLSAVPLEITDNEENPEAVLFGSVSRRNISFG
jgi:hypothetical protein